MQLFIAITRLIGAILPIGCVIVVILLNRHQIRIMDDRLKEMQSISDGMKDMMLNPKAWVNSRYGKENPN